METNEFSDKPSISNMNLPSLISPSNQNFGVEQ